MTSPKTKFKLYCSLTKDVPMGTEFINQMRTALNVVYTAFTTLPEQVELRILSPKEWINQPFGKSQPYGSPIVPQTTIYIGSGIDQQMIKGIKSLQTKIGQKIEFPSLKDYGLLMVHELAHILIRSELTEEHWMFKNLSALVDSDFFFLGEFHAQLTLATYL
ncbi:MAG: hypothetical protein ACFFBD_27100, partial [Candidatus Hodarchaeota archaeon]